MRSLLVALLIAGFTLGCSQNEEAPPADTGGAVDLTIPGEVPPPATEEPMEE